MKVEVVLVKKKVKAVVVKMKVVVVKIKVVVMQTPSSGKNSSKANLVAELSVVCQSIPLNQVEPFKKKYFFRSYLPDWLVAVIEDKDGLP